MMIRFYLGADKNVQEARYALSVLLDGIGVAGNEVDEVSRADLVHSVAPPSTNCVWIPADEMADWGRRVESVAWRDDVPFAGDSSTPEIPPDLVGIHGDILRMTFMIATGVCEREDAKNNWGVPLAASSWLHQQDLLAEPTVALYAHHMEEKLRHLLGGFQGVPKWPEGKRYAIVLSHDVDRPFSRPSAVHYRRRFRRDVRRRHLGSAVRAMAGYTKNVLLKGDAARAATSDPNFGFDAWLRREAEWGTRSAFYVAVTTSADDDGAPEDVNYDFRHPEILARLHRAVAEDWEVGLHASIGCREDSDMFSREKHVLETALDGYQVNGLRHHYWAMDGAYPERTLAAHAAAGFTYDSSLGLNDAPGFRRGMAWPFNPYHRLDRRPLPILQVPPTLMDGGIFYHDVTPDEGAEHIREHIATVRRHGGAAVLNWHLEQQNPARLRGAGPALGTVLDELSDSEEIFWATPLGVAEWWQERRRKIQA